MIMQKVVEVKPFEQTEPVCFFSKPEQAKPERWEQNISELEHYFSNITLPSQPIRADECSIITDVPKFISAHLAIIKANQNKATFKPYLERLKQLKETLTSMHYE